MTTRKMTPEEVRQADQEYRAALIHIATFGLFGQPMPEPEAEAG